MIDIKDIVMEGSTPTATSSGSISLDELYAQLKESVELLKDTIPEYRKSIAVPKGQSYIIDPSELGFEFWGFKRKTIILNPEDYMEMFPEESEESED
jgi:hypothetical protein